jgi:chemotaxis protein histidine kinase CheA/ActR/RegA family two-component response regulator
MSSSFDKFAILDSFLDEVGSYLPEIEGNLDRLEEAPEDSEALEEAYRRAHTIGGSASMMDFPGLSQVAHAMEDVLGDALDEVLRLDGSAIALLRRSLERARKLLEAIKAGAADDGRVVAENAADFASFRQSHEARTAANSSIQDAIIVTSDAPAVSDPGSAVHTGIGAEEWAGFEEPSAASRSGAAEASTAFEATPGMPTWLSLLGNSDHLTSATASASEVSAADASQELEFGRRITRPLPGMRTPVEALQSAELKSEMPPGYQEHTPAQEEQGFVAGQGDSAPAFTGAPASTADDEPTLVAASGEQQPSLAEMLAAFQSPQSGEWPEQPLALETPTTAASLSPSSAMPAASARADQILEALAAGDRPTSMSAPQQWRRDQGMTAFASPVASSTTHPIAPSGGDRNISLTTWQELVEHEEQVRQGAASLKETLAALRALVTTIEHERAELRGFLDGSKDAIDRLEDWAGKAMGLNLRQSPDHVRRYLPLSVLWVVTTRLKKMLSMLKDAATGLATTDGELSAASMQLAASIQACGPLISSLLSMTAPPQEGSFSATVAAHISWTPPAKEQPAAMPTGFNERARPQTIADIDPRLRAEIVEQVRREEIHRLRQELEIEVRQQVLSSLNFQGGMLMKEQAPSTPVYQEPAVTVPQFTVPGPKKIVRATEQSEETLEVFRAEAEEHLQTIDAGITALEKAPEDREILQGIRRATHTLKGAAAMMGFAHIADLSHIFEDLLDRIMEGGIALDGEVIGLILDTSEALEQLVAGRTAEHGGDVAVVDALRPRYQLLLGQEAEEGVGGESGRPESIEDLETEAARELAGKPDQGEQQASHLVALGAGSEATDKGELSVRVRLKKLDELVNLFGEMLVNRSILEERLGRLMRMVADVNLSSTRLNEVGTQLESRFEAALLPSGRVEQASAVHTGVAGSSAGAVERTSAQGRPFPVPSGPVGGSPSKFAAHLADFDELELDRYSEFHRLSRGLSEGVSDMTTLSSEMETIIRECESIFGRESRLSSTFQDQLLKMRLVPISSIVPRLYRTARAVALRLGKEVELEVEGEETEVDRSIYEEMAGALLHVVRNAVTHGIETPDAREAAGKPRVGQIKLSASYEGNQIVITVRDDGTGIDAERVRSTAIARGLLDARAPLSEQAVLNLIFRPGFSTAEVISEESGRGVGLDVVADVARRLRGSVEVESTPGNGSAFTMKFPISVQIQRAVLVRAGDQTYAIPMAVVEQIGRLDYCERTGILGVPAVMIRGEAYELVQLGSLLGLPTDKIDDRASVLLIMAGRRRYALVADAVLGKQEIVAKDLGHHLREVRGVAGATVLGNGQVVLILEVLELLARRQQLTRPNLPAFSGGSVPAAISSVPTRSLAPTWSSSLPVVGRESPPPPGRAEEQYVLVVDDSPSVRRVVSNMLKMAGWEVQTARDGLETLEIAAKRKPAAILLDIEMPRMDGYELIATLRSQDQYKHLPVIVLTSRAANKHQQRAVQLGADAYLVKPYQDEELLRTLNTLVRGARATT